MRTSRFERVLNLVLKGEPVYIKDTGISVIVINFDWHKENRNRKFMVQIHFEDVPNKKAIQMCDHFRIRTDLPRGAKTLNSTPGSLANTQNYVNIEAHINVDDLSDIPYESKAAKTLYKK